MVIPTLAAMTGGTQFNGSTNDYTATATFLPVTRFSTTVGMQYDSNLQTSVEQQLANLGIASPAVNLGDNSHSMSFYNYDSLYILHNLSASFNFNRIQQEVYGESVDVNHYSGLVNYHVQKPFWGSLLLFGGVTDDSTDAGHQGTGLVAGANFTRLIKGWDVGASFSYSQDVQTVLAVTNTSEYPYNASLRRKFGRNLLWNSTFSGYHSGLSVTPGQTSYSESGTSSISYKGYGLNGGYGRSVGTALLTANGLVAAPINIPVTVLERINTCWRTVRPTVWALPRTRPQDVNISQLSYAQSVTTTSTGLALEFVQVFDDVFTVPVAEGVVKCRLYAFYAGGWERRVCRRQTSRLTILEYNDGSKPFNTGAELARD